MRYPAIKNQDKVLENFFTHLEVNDVSRVSRKNYASDINHFLGWLIFKLKSSWGTQIEALSEAIAFLKPDLVKEYRDYLTENSLSDNTVNRRLSTLRQLAKFLTTTQLLNFDFMEGISNVSHIETSKSSPFLDEFGKHLASEKISEVTAKNYLSDIRHFLAWIESRENLKSKI